MGKEIQNKKAFGILVSIYLLSIYPIIRADFNYADDVGRVFKGYSGWHNFSRWLSTIFSHFVHAGIHLADISPLPQILAVCILAVSCLVVLRTVNERDTFSIWDIIAVFPLGISPYFLECLSYKYDAPYMALSILASVVPLLFYKKDFKIYGGAAIVGMVIMCTTYQASSGIFPMCVILLAFLRWNRGEKIRCIVQFVVTSAISYMIGIGIFSLLLMRHVGTEEYVSSEITTINNIIAHYSEYFRWVRADFKIEWLLLTGILGIWFVVVSVYSSRRGRVFAFCLSVVVECLMFVFCFGLYPMLEKPLFAPRALYGTGAYIALIGVAGTKEKMCIKWRWPARVTTAVLAWSFLTFALAYGNALGVQNEYTEFRMTEVIEDLSDLEELNGGETVVVQLCGTIGLAPAIEDGPNNCNMLTRLIPIMFKEDWIWGGYKFFHYYGLKNISWNMEAGMYMDAYGDWPLLHESMYHRIYGQDNYIVIELK